MSTSTHTVPETANTELVKGLGLTSATTLVMGSMIGSGIFIVSAEISREVNSPALLLGAWLVTGFMTIVGALSYGELAAMMPRAGGQYVYLRESLGPLWGFLYGWTLFLVIQTGTIAAVGVAFGKFLGFFFPAISASRRILHVPIGRFGTWVKTENLPAPGTGVVTALYVAANFVYLNVLPLNGAEAGADVLARGIKHAAEDRVGTAVMFQMFGQTGAALMAIAILVSTFGCCNGLILAG